MIIGEIRTSAVSDSCNTISVLFYYLFICREASFQETGCRSGAQAADVWSMLQCSPWASLVKEWILHLFVSNGSSKRYQGTTQGFCRPYNYRTLDPALYFTARLHVMGEVHISQRLLTLGLDSIQNASPMGRFYNGRPTLQVRFC